jgi:hypothetical protein
VYVDEFLVQMTVSALGEGARALPFETVTVRVAVTATAVVEPVAGVRVIVSVEVPAEAFLHPPSMVKVKLTAVLVLMLVPEAGSVTAVTGALTAVRDVVTADVIPKAPALPVVAVTATTRGAGPRTVSQVRAIAAGLIVNPAVACRVPVQMASASTTSGIFEK